MKRFLIITAIIITLLVTIGLITSYIDMARVRNSVEPKYTIKIITDGGNKVTYWGLGYKVIRYTKVSSSEPYKNNRGVKYGNWFMKYELKEENQILKLSCNLNNINYYYTIEYDYDNNIVKVDNTDYYNFLKDGKLITDVSILDAELTSYFIKNGGNCQK
ncbi:MAG: hypothetical protein IJZ79_07115 [Bacilli bacterium]|nr:hypothetical protein [Bacilli bacterium]